MPARILIVEDNPANLELMRYLLKASGYVVFTAVDGEEGLSVARRERPDLIVCDIQLPLLNGYQVAQRLKAHAALRAVPLLAVTAFAMVGDREQLLAAGFDGYLPKPIDPEAFVSQVASFLPAALRSAPPNDCTRAMEACLPPAERAILVVDNDAVNLQLATRLLEPCGYHVLTAGAMQQALAVAREGRPALILSDVRMAEGSGYDFIEQVKADPQLRSIPFVFLTSTMIDEKERTRGLALGAVRYLFRPIEPELLLAEIEACLRAEGV